MNTHNAPQLLLPWVTRHFFKNLMMDAILYPKLFNVNPIGTAYADEWQISGLGTFASKPEGTPISYDDPVASDRKRVVMLTFALGFRATEEMLEDDQFGIVRRMSADLGESGRDHQENLAWGVLNDGGAGATYTGIPEGDGTRRSLWNTGHVRLKASGTASNRLNPGLNLSEAAIEAMITNLELTQSEEGRFSAIEGRNLVIHSNERWNAEKILNTQQEVGTANNTINAVARLGLSVLRVPYLTDTDAFSIWADKSKHSLTFYMRKKMATDSMRDGQSKDSLFDARYRAQVTFGPWQGTVGSIP